MTPTTIPDECPNCASSKNVREKLLLINPLNAGHLEQRPGERSSCACEGGLSVDGLKPGFVAEAPLQQFVAGLYCEACGTGFVPEGMAKPAAQSWKLSELGFHRVNEDGSLGPPQERMG
ncbi:hypothetical protein [Polaromonas sp. YR568]|uniref:hypothetical protein n=1 Tax=Polaromonas sp. YR568 TaxID=1855301 RepID=UPI00398C1DFF